MLDRVKQLFALGAGMALLVAAPALAHAQGTEKTEQDPPQGAMHEGMHGMMSQGQSGSTMDCQQMMQKKKDMQARQKQMNGELDALVSRMEGASGEAQQKVMVELLAKLVAQREAMQGRMMAMQPMMMQHMMEHMHSGGDMSDCPMMKSMQAGEASAGEASAGEASAGESGHSQHH